MSEKIEIKQEEKSDIVLVNGIRLPEIWFEYYIEDDEDFEDKEAKNKIFRHMNFFGEEMYKKISQFSLEDFYEFKSVSFQYPHAFQYKIDEILVSWIRFITEDDKVRVQVECIYSVDYWERSRLLQEILQKFTKKYLQKNIENWHMENFLEKGEVPQKDDDGDGTIFFWRDFELSQDFHPSLLELIDGINEVHYELADEIGFSEKTESVVRVFDFPDEVRVYCEQYLIYFSQFLRDLGVQSHASISEADRKSIFRVKPKDKDEALEKIYKALEVYLNLPTVITLDQFPSPDSNIEVEMLYNQIHDLQNKWGIVIEKIRQKNLSLTMQDRIIQEQNQQNQLLLQSIESGRILKESMKSESKDCEEIIPGVISVKKQEFGPFEVDLPNIYRELKKLFLKLRDD